ERALEDRAVLAGLNLLLAAVFGQGRIGEADVVGNQALALARKLGDGKNRDVPAVLLIGAETKTTLGRHAEAEQPGREAVGRHAEAEQLAKEVVAAFRRVYGKPSGWSLYILAQAQARQGKFADAEVHLREALPLFAPSPWRDPNNTRLLFLDLLA